MAKSLAEYAAQNPQEIPPQELTAQKKSKKINERWKELEEAQNLKENILIQINKGTPPQTVLYMALSCIGLLTDDKDWTSQTQSTLDNIYSDLAQLSLLVDNEKKEQERLQKLQVEYNTNLKATIQKKIKNLAKINTSLQAVLDTLNTLE